MEHTTEFNPYTTLEVEWNVNNHDLKAAFKSAAKRTHPDTNGIEKEEEFKLVLKAYNVLKNPETRRLFDETGHVAELEEISIRKEMVDVVQGAYKRAIEQCNEKNTRMNTLDFLLFVKQNMEAGRKTCTEQLDVIQSNISFLHMSLMTVEEETRLSNPFFVQMAESLQNRRVILFQYTRAALIFDLLLSEINKHTDYLEFVLDSPNWSTARPSTEPGVMEE